MRLLLLVLKILISTSLLTHSTDIFASVGSKNGRIHDKKGLRKVAARPTIDVWERIRIGMQIPRLASTQILTEQSSTIKPQSAVKIISAPAPILNPSRTVKLDLGLPIITTVSPDSPVLVRTSQQPTFRDSGFNLPKSIAIQSRFHTRLGFHPKLNQTDSKIVSESDTHQAPLKVITAENSQLKTEAVSSGKNSQTKNATVLARKNSDTKEQVNEIPNKEERIEKHLAWYSKHSDYLNQVAERAKPYLYHIVDGLARNKLPVDLALLPIVESAYQPNAQSPKSAAGLWQFIPSTGLDFDLKQSAHYDDRLDIDASTQAAIRYLSFLKNHYNGDWHLALAAYNCGQGAVDAAISRNQAEGLATDFWSLRLPEETQDYVPRFLAVSSIFSNPGHYGLKLPAVRNEPYFIKVKIERTFDIKYIAKKELTDIASLANLSYEQFTQLNPGYLNPTLTSDGPFTFLMPIANANQLHRHLSSVAQLLDESSVPVVSEILKKADNSDSVQSSILPISVTSLQELELPIISNSFLSINVDARQTTPRIVSSPDVISFGATNAGEEQLTVHYVDNGETLATIARNFDVSVKAILETNNFLPNQKLVLGQQLKIPVKVSTSA